MDIVGFPAWIIADSPTISIEAALGLVLAITFAILGAIALLSWLVFKAGNHWGNAPRKGFWRTYLVAVMATALAVVFIEPFTRLGMREASSALPLIGYAMVVLLGALLGYRQSPKR
ncbi:MAG: hypothetical protein ACFB10_13720 [Salibacteraceae bacterium]